MKSRSSYPRTQPSRLVTSLVELPLAFFALNAESHSPQRARVPAADEVALATVLSFDRVAELDVVCVPTHCLRERPLQAVGVGGAFRAAGRGIAMGGTVVGDGGGREVIPPFAGGALGEEGVSVGEEGGECEGFLDNY